MKGPDSDVEINVPSIEDTFRICTPLGGNTVDTMLLSRA